MLVGRFGRTYLVIERKGLFAHIVLGGSLRSSGDCSITVLVARFTIHSSGDRSVTVLVGRLCSIQLMLPLIYRKGLYFGHSAWWFASLLGTYSVIEGERLFLHYIGGSLRLWALIQ